MVKHIIIRVQAENKKKYLGHFSEQVRPKDRFGAIFFAPRCRLILPLGPFMRPPLAALNPTPLMDRFAFHLRLATWKWIFWPIFAHSVEHTRTFPQNFSNCKSPASKKSYGCSKIHFLVLCLRKLWRCLFTFSPESLARVGRFS